MDSAVNDDHSIWKVSKIEQRVQGTWVKVGGATRCSPTRARRCRCGRPSQSPTGTKTVPVEVKVPENASGSEGGLRSWAARLLDPRCLPALGGRRAEVRRHHGPQRPGPGRRWTCTPSATRSEQDRDDRPAGQGRDRAQARQGVRQVTADTPRTAGRERGLPARRPCIRAGGDAARCRDFVPCRRAGASVTLAAGEARETCMRLRRRRAPGGGRRAGRRDGRVGRLDHRLGAVPWVSPSPTRRCTVATAGGCRSSPPTRSPASCCCS